MRKNPSHLSAAACRGPVAARKLVGARVECIAQHTTFARAPAEHLAAEPGRLHAGH
jgi:hypothetical protein